MRRIVALGACFLLGASSCAGAKQTERTVRVDFRQDEFASHYWRFFPGRSFAHPGDTVVFDQQWTGEPHTVTLGTLVDRALPRLQSVERKYADVNENSPPEVLARAERAYQRAGKGLPTFNPYTDAAAQNWTQPCYLSRGSPPTDPDTPCRKRTQPVFDGHQSYFSSGFIAPSGPNGNTYRVRLDDNIKPGTYRFYCIIHFPWMQGRIEVKPKDTKLPTATETNAKARNEIERLAGPLRQALATAKSGKATYGQGGAPLRLPLGGFHSADEFTVAIDEFVPKTIQTRVGEKVTWTLVGAHTVSFDVPKYVPIYFVSKGGTVRRNPTVDRAAGGSPPPPPITFDKGPYRIDGGKWDGSGFFSSGLVASEPYAQYSLRFTKPGRYRYACLVHPPMVGHVVVTG